MLPSSFLVFLSVATAAVSASPVQRPRKRCNDAVINPPIPPADSSPPAAVTPKLPVNGGASELDGPASNATLKRILVGHGIQNYTCATASDPKATSTGALAVVWDVQALYPGSGSGSVSEAEWAGLTPQVLRTTDLPLNLLSSSSSSAQPYAADPTAPFPPAADLDLPAPFGTLAFAGHHYFDGAGVPTFALHADESEQESVYFQGQRDGGVVAPADADRGLTDSGAVDWLRLKDKGTSRGASLVFRVFTAGGNPAPCAEAGQTESVPYTAMYWFY